MRPLLGMAMCFMTSILNDGKRATESFEGFGLCISMVKSFVNKREKVTQWRRAKENSETRMDRRADMSAA